jgi:hypothetical protein
MKKSTSATLSIFIAFVLVSSIFSINGNGYAQQTPITPETSFNSSTASMPNATENTTGFDQQQNQTTTIPELQQNNSSIIADTNNTNTQSIDENTTQSDAQNASSNHVTRDSVTLLLEDRSLPEGSFIHLYDSTPFKIVSGHVAAKLPCNSDNATDVNVLVGQAPNVSPAELEFIPELSTAGALCLYHVDLASNSTNPVTDVAILNNSTDDIDFPATSTVVIGVNEISELSSEGHGNTS